MDDAMLTIIAHEMQHKPADKLTWADIFFRGSEQSLGFQNQWVHNLEKNHRQFWFKKLLLVKPLNKPPVECPIQVWELMTETGLYAVKLFDEYTDEDARIQLSRISKNHLPPYSPSLDEMREDADPLLLELLKNRLTGSARSHKSTFFLDTMGRSSFQLGRFPAVQYIGEGESSWICFNRGQTHGLCFP